MVISCRLTFHKTTALLYVFQGSVHLSDGFIVWMGEILKRTLKLSEGALWASDAISEINLQKTIDKSGKVLYYNRTGVL